MSNYDSLIFDLDGTLWDACHITAVSWNQALKSLGLPQSVTAEQVQSISGLVDTDIFKEIFSHLSIDPQLLQETLFKFERQYIEKEGGQIYAGVPEGIIKLKKFYKLYIVSNCQEWYLDAFLNFSDLKEYFSDWESHGRTKKPKGQNIKDLIKRNQLKNPVYIGDTEVDLHATKFAHIDFVYARYGHNTVSHTPFVNDFHELVEYFLKSACL